LENTIEQFKKDLATLNPKIYPGHGKPSDISLLDEVKNTLKILRRLLRNRKQEPKQWKQCRICIRIINKQTFYFSIQ